jgi:hypothetical protein
MGLSRSLGAAALNSLLGAAGSAFCDGMPFDELWRRSLFRDAGLTMNFSVLSMEMLPLRDGHRMVKWLKSNKEIPHRAGPDALRLMRAYAYAFKERPLIEIIDRHE